MKTASKLLVALLTMSGAMFAPTVFAYGAGTTTQPSMQRQAAEQQRQKSISYYQPAPPKVNYGQYGHVDRTMGSLGFTPNVVVKPATTPMPTGPTAAQIGSRFIEKHPQMGGLVAATATTGHFVAGVANTTIAVGNVATTISQPYTAPATLPGAALRGGMAVNNFRQACNAGVWMDYAKQVQKQQACIPYPGMK